MRIGDVIALCCLIVVLVVCLIIGGALQSATANIVLETQTNTTWKKIIGETFITYFNNDTDYQSTWNATSCSAFSDTNEIGQSNETSEYQILRTALFFDVSVYSSFWSASNISQYEVIAAKLELNVTEKGSGWNDYVTIQADLTPPINEHPSLPQNESDYNKDLYSGNLGTRNVTATGSQNITLTTQGINFLDSAKNSFGNISLLLRSQKDIDGTAPSSQNETITISGAALYMQVQWDTSVVNAEYSSAYSTLFSNFYSGMTLATITIVVSAAIGILALVLENIKVEAFQ